MMNAPLWAFVVTTMYLGQAAHELVHDPVVVAAASTEHDEHHQEVSVPVPEEEWSDETKLELAQCWVGETDWGRATEKAIIAHILAKRWRRATGQPLVDPVVIGEGAPRPHPRVSFAYMLHRYCAVLHVRHPTDRQQWVRNLPWGELEQDPGFPSTVNWKNYVVPWRHVRELVDRFAAGDIPDPMPRAMHWGSPQDSICTRRDAEGVCVFFRARIRGAVMLPRTIASIEDGEPVQLTNVIYALEGHVRRTAPRPTGHGVISAAVAMGRRRSCARARDAVP